MFHELQDHIIDSEVPQCYNDLTTEAEAGPSGTGGGVSGSQSPLESLNQSTFHY